MANPYEHDIESGKWGNGSKDDNASVLYNKYKSLYNPYNPKQQDLFVKELIRQFEESLERNAHLYQNFFNDTEISSFAGY